MTWVGGDGCSHLLASLGERCSGRSRCCFVRSALVQVGKVLFQVCTFVRKPAAVVSYEIEGTPVSLLVNVGSRFDCCWLNFADRCGYVCCFCSVFWVYGRVRRGGVAGPTGRSPFRRMNRLRRCFFWFIYCCSLL